MASASNPVTEPGDSADDAGKHADTDATTAPEGEVYGNGGRYPTDEFLAAQAAQVEADPTLKSRTS